MMNRIIFSRAKDEWNTPKELYEKLNKEFCFDFDPCPENYVIDGLTITWGARNFVNPPYSKWQKWMQKGYEEYLKGKLVVFLIPARTDTKAFHKFCWDDDHNRPYPFVEIRHIPGRLKFGNSENGAPFPNMLIIFDPDKGIYNIEVKCPYCKSSKVKKNGNRYNKTMEIQRLRCLTCNKTFKKIRLLKTSDVI